MTDKPDGVLGIVLGKMKKKPSEDSSGDKPDPEEDAGEEGMKTACMEVVQHLKAGDEEEAAASLQRAIEMGR